MRKAYNEESSVIINAFRMRTALRPDVGGINMTINDAAQPTESVMVIR